MSTYSIYLDETGDFQGNEEFYAICGFVWKGDALNLKECLSGYCRGLAEKLKKEGRDSGLAFPECLHTTENKSLKKILQKKDSTSSILHIPLKDFPISSVGIYAFKDEIDKQYFHQDVLYRTMLLKLVRDITTQIRQIDKDADITFHVPTRDTFFEINGDKEKLKYQQNDIIVGTRFNRESGGANYSVSMNTPEAFTDIRNELGVQFSVREITYKTTNPDANDNSYHSFKNTESTLWGYYTADIINYWVRVLANNYDLSVETVVSGLAEQMEVFYMQPFSRNIEQATLALNKIHENPCLYLEILKQLYDLQESSPRDIYAINMMERSNPAVDQHFIRYAKQQIDQLYIHQSKYTYARQLLERLSALCEQADNINNRNYSDVIAALMTCYHHEGGNNKAQELFEKVRSKLGNDHCSTMDICNKYQEFYVNTLSFEKGIDFVSAVLKQFSPKSSPLDVGGIIISGSSISQEETSVNARTVSSLGSLHAYLDHASEAEELFLKSIQDFESIGQYDNAQITRSHYAHFLLDTDDIRSEKLLTILNQYFTGKTPESRPDPYNPATWDLWMNSFVDHCTDNEGFNQYAGSFYLWVWLKAMASLPKEVINGKREFLLPLSRYPQVWESMKLQDHPAEGLRKYHAILSIRVGDNRSAKKDEEILNRIIEFKHNHGTIPLLCRMAKYEIALEKNDLPPEALQCLERGVTADIETLYNEFHSGNADETSDSLIDRLKRAKPLSIETLKDCLKYEFR